MKKNYILPILLGVAGIALVYSYISKSKKKGGKDIPEPLPSPEPKSEQKVIVGTDIFPLGSGSKGYNVQQLQIALGGKAKLPISFKKGKPDGVFGLETERVLMEQTGKNSVASLSELESIANKNDLVKSFTKSGYTFIPKSQQNILAKVPKNPL